MPNIAITSKETKQLLLSADTNTVTLSENSVVKIDTAIEDVASITREGNAAIVNLKNGEKVVIESYFDDPLDSHHIVFDNGEQLYWAEFANAAGEILPTIKYHFIETISPLLYADTLAALMPWVTGAVAAGATIAAVGSDSDSASSNTPVDSTAAEQLVIAAEEAQQAAEDLLNQAQEDGLITSEEQAQLQDAADAAAEAKDTAQDAVTALPESADKEELQDRLDAINDPITVPPVNDADGNGIDDAFEAAEALVTDAENAHQAAEDVIAGAQEDGLISPAEQQAIQDAVDAATEAEQTAQDAVTALPESTDKDGLQDRLDTLTDITVPAVTDTDGNGIDDAVDAQIADTEAAVKAAEDAYQAAEDALEEANANGLITPTEKAELEEALKAAQDAKDAAQDAVDALPSSPAAVQDAKDGFQDRIDALTDITIPAVNDANENGVDDSTENPVDLATDLVEAAEDAYQAAEDALTDANTDGLITPEEQAALEDALKDAQDAKDAAQNAVDALPDSADKDALQDRIDALTDITVPAVTDTDGNGIDDAVDAQIADAEAAVKAAEDAYQAAEDALEEANANGLITPTEKAALEEALQAAQDAKDAAQDAVDALPSSPAAVQDAKDGFQDRIDALTDITIPAVNDANENGVDDSTENPVDLATDLVEVAEDAYQAAEDALTDANTDGLITPEEQAALEDALKDAQDAKDAAQNAVDALPDSADKDALQDRIDALTDITVPAVTDTDGNGIDDAVDAQIADAEAAVKAAEDAYQAAEDALEEANANGLITPTEKAALEEALQAAQDAKDAAQDAVDALPSSPAAVQDAKDGFQDRIDALTDITIPAVNDANENGVDDSTENPVDLATDLVEVAEDAYQAAEDALTAANTDGLITPEEKAALDDALKDAQDAKDAAQNAVDALPDSADKDALQDRLDALTDIVLPTVNDENGNGIDDATDLSSVEDLVADAEQAYQDAADALAAAESDNLITPSELATLTQNLADAQQAKADAQAAVDAIEAEYPTAAGKFQDRLDALTDIVLPTVNDENGNGIDDATDLSSVEDLVADAEQAYQDAADALAAAESDNLITPSELATLTQNLADAQQAKADAQAAVDAIEAEYPTAAGKFQDRLDALTDIVLPTVNDENGNGIDDATDLSSVEDLVADAEQAYQDAADALAAAESDNLITPSELATLTQNLADAQQAKADAQAAVDAIEAEYPTAAGKFQDRLDALTDIVLPTVNDENGNGIDDATDLSSVEDLVADAEQAYQDAADALAAAESDNLITPSELATLTQNLADAQQAKADAQAAVDAIEAEYPTAAGKFQDRLDALTDIVLPTVNDENGNGIDDATDLSSVEDLVADAEQAYQDAADALAAAESDNLITPSELATLTQNLADAQQAKADAQAAVDAIEAEYPTAAGKFQDRLDALTDIVLPTVNDENGNGIDDATDLSSVEDLVADAEQAYQDAADALAAAESDNLITPSELATLTQNLADAQQAKADAQAAVDAIEAEYPTAAGKFQDRLDALTDIVLPTVNDENGNGIDDATDLSSVEDLVADAEQAYQDAADALAAAESDNLITPSELATLTQNLADAQQAKADAQAAVDAIEAEYPTAAGKFQDRLDALTDIVLPTVNDENGNGIDDATDLSSVEDLVADAEQAYQDAADALAAAESDNLITPSELATLTQNLADAQQAKADAQAAVDAIEAEYPTAAGKFQDRLDALTDIVLPTVNDENGNGIDDATDLSSVEDLVADAEQAYQDAADALAAAESDNLITPSELATLTQNLADAQQAKADAQAAVDAIEAEYPTAAGKFQDRLDALTDIVLPTVNDENGNGIDDATDLSSVEDLVADAEQAYQDAADALAAAESDNLITPSELATLTQNLADAQQAKADAQAAVDAIEAEYPTAAGKFQDRLDALTDIVLPTVNDENGNGIDDATDLSSVEDLVADAEQAYQDAADALAAAESDNLITPSELATLTQNLADAQQAKADAQAAVDAIEAEYPTAAGKFQDRLDALTDIVLPTVNDENGNGIDDATDLSSVEDLVADAEQAYQDAADALAAAESDNLITPSELATLTQNLADAQQAKADAQAAVDAIEAEYPTAAGKFQDRLDALTDIVLPTVNDENGNGIDDATDLSSVEDLVADAEQAYQDAADALAAAESDNLITPSELATLTQNLADAQQAKADAQAAVDAIEAEYPTAAGKFQDRLDALTDIVLPTVNDENGNGIDDATDLSSVEDLVADAEQAYQDAADALAAAESDNLITPSELATLTQNLADAQQAKADAQAAVDAIEAEYPTAAGKFQDRLDALTDIVLPTVNDENGNGIDDATDLSSVEDLVADAEQAYQDAADALAAAESDNLITPSELATLTQNLADAQQAKADAQAAVDAIEAEYPTAAGKFQDRLDALTDIVLPTVNDENGNGIDDATDLSSVEDLVADAEQAYQDAADALAAAESDNLITPSELATLTQNLADAQQAKADAQAAVDAIEAEYPTAAGKFQDRLDALTDIVLPTVNDENGNGIDDATDLSSVEDLVADAEQAYQDAADALAAAESDNLITPSELATLTQNLADAQQAKADAQAAVDAIEAEYPTAAGKFQDRLDALTDIVLPTVNDENGNGIDDATDLSSVEDLVADAEQAYQDAADALAAAESDNLITPSELATLTQNLADAQQAKADAQAAVDAIEAEYPTAAGKFQDRLDALTDIVLPTVNDENGNGIDDATDLSSVEDLVADAEQAYQDAADALAAAESDNLITPSELATLTQNLADAQQAKADAQAAVDAIEAEYPTAAGKFQDRLDALTDIVLPTVNDENGNGIDDATDLSSVEDLVADAEQAYQDAADALAAAESDNLITPSELATLTQNLADAQQAKADAQAAVDAIEAEYPTAAGKFQDRLDALTDIVLPTVNDENGNGIDDATDLSSVEDLVADAEQAYQDAADALAAAESDNLITPSELATLTQNLADAQQAKADAQAAVDAIEAEYPTAAGKFQDRLDALTDIVLPTVNDENGNGIDDATDLSSVEDLVADAEQAYQDAADALAAAESDNLITPSELATLTQNLADAQQAKADAQAAVDAIEAEYPTAAGKFQDRLDALTDIVLPTVNDENGNGIDDATDLSSVEDLVADAEQAYQDAADALAAAESDNLITPSELATLTQNLADAQQAKADAQAAVDAIEAEYPTAAGKFQDRLDALTDIVLPTVNDENGNGIDDATDLSSVEDLVADAEQAYQDAADALAAAESDNLITPSELATLTQNLADAQQAKADAQAAVDAIEAEYPTAAGKFQDRLDALTDIVLPTVNDENGNGIDDATDLSSVEDLVADAEQAYQDAADALAAAESDNLITPSELATLTQNLADAQQAKADAQAAVDAIEAEYPTAAGKFQDRLDALTDIVLPTVNDENGNGIDDATEIAAVEDLVAEAEAAYQAADQALTDALVDGVTQAEVDDLTQALADAQQAKADAQAAVNGIVDDFPTEAADFQGRLNDLTDIVIPAVTPTLNAINDEYVLDMGQEALIERDAESYNDVTYIDLLGGTEGEILGADFSIPQDPNDVGQAHTGNITITASQQDFLSVAEAFQLIVYQNVDGVQTEVARIGNQGGVVTLGGVGILGIVNNPGGISVTLSDLPEGEYTAVVAKDSSLLSDLIYGIELDKLGGEEAILGASNEQAIYNAINAVLTPELAAPLVTLVQAILVPVNTIGLPISSVVSQLLDVLPVEVIDELVNQVVGPLVTNTLTLYENTDITIDGTEETFLTYTFSSNVFEDNGNGVDVAPAGTIISEIDGTPVSGIEIIQGDYGVLEINTVTGAFTYKVTTGEEALGKTEIFNYTIQNGTQTDTAQIIIDISGTAFDDGTLLPPDYLDQVVANDDLATVQNYYEEPGDDIGTTGGASQLLGVSLVGIDISLGSEVPFNFEVEQNTTSDVTIGTQTLTQSSGDVVITGTYGNLTISGDGEYSYQANTANYGGVETFNYTLTSLSGETSTATLTIGVGRDFTSSAFNDFITTNSNGGDTVIYNLLNSASNSGGNGTDIWKDFSATQGDKIDLSALLQGQAVDANTLSHFVSVEQRGDDTVVTIDRDGSATDTTYAKTDLIILENTTASNLVLDDLIKYNQI